MSLKISLKCYSSTLIIFSVAETEQLNSNDSSIYLICNRENILKIFFEIFYAGENVCCHTSNFRPNSVKFLCQFAGGSRREHLITVKFLTFAPVWSVAGVFSVPEMKTRPYKNKTNGKA
jgi:hypothetical protein